MNYRREIDGLRALAVLPVILFHAGFQTFSGGFIGVDIFFVISGYLITSIIINDLQNGQFSLAGFYERRARRILPALFLVTFACLPFAWALMLPKHLQEFSQSLVAVSTFVSNILFWRQSGYFDTVTELKPLLHTWSLAIEEQYYVLFPLLLMFAWHWGRKFILALLAIGFVISLGAAQWGSIYKPSATFYLLPTRGWELLLGAFIAFFSTHIQNIKPTIATIGSTLGVLCIIASIFLFDEKTPFPSLYTLLPTLGTCLVIICANNNNFVGRWLGTPVIVGLGLISYSAYLWHQPLLAFTRYAVSSAPSPMIMGSLVIVTLLLAYLSWRFVEKPFRNRANFTRHQIFAFSSVAIIFFVALGFVGHFNNGFPHRLTAEQTSRADLFKEAHEDRQKLIKFDICHFNNLTNTGIDNFLKQWNCGNTSDASLKPLPIAITGDSHAADIVVALKLNGYNPLQLAGANCSLVPRYMTPPCKKIYQKLYEEIKDNKNYTHIALVNQFDSKELTPDALHEMVTFWKKYDKKLIFFTGMPEFHNFEVDFVKGRTPHPNFTISTLSLSKGLYGYLQSQDITVINTAGLFCAVTDHCKQVVKNGQSYLTDNHHMSRIGATAFGAQLLESDFPQ